MQDWKIFALSSAIFAGLTAVLAKVGVKNVPSNFATLIRTFVVIFFLSFLIGIRNEWRNPFLLDKRSLIFLILSGFSTGLSWLCYYRALQTGSASLVTSIDKTGLLFAVLLSVLFLGERLNIYEWIAAALIFTGTLMIALK